MREYTQFGADSSGIPLQGVELNRILSGAVQSPPRGPALIWLAVRPALSRYRTAEAWGLATIVLLHQPGLELRTSRPQRNKHLPLYHLCEIAFATVWTQLARD
jgi:hypothetical protein